ncbi:Meiotic cell cortex C-terminal pleckstrin homology, putative [Leishmania shawi]
MDSLHEAHLARILEARRRRGVLGPFCDLVAAPPREYANAMISPPPPPPTSPLKRRGSSMGTQTACNLKMSTAAQTACNLKMSTAAQTAPTLTSPTLTSPNPKATLDGGLRFRSPGRVPSLAYSTPSSASRRRIDPWRSPASASSPSAWLSGAEERARSIESLIPPLYIPRSRFVPRKPLWPERSPSIGPLGGWDSFPHSSPLAVAPTGMNTWRNRSCPNMCTLPMTGNQRDTSHLSRWGDGATTAPLMAWPSSKSGGSCDNHHTLSRHRSREHRRGGTRPCDEDYDGSKGRGVDFPPERHGHSGVRASSPRDASCQRRENSRQRRGAGLDEDGGVNRERRSGRQGRYHARQRGEVYAPPVVCMGSAARAAPPSPSSREGSSRRSRSASMALLPQRSLRLSQGAAQVERKFSLGLPDVRSTMDLRTSVETLRGGDWFYKWTAKGDSVHRRWVWIDTKDYLLVWSNYETYSPHFCGNVRLDHICQVTSHDLSSMDENGLPKTYYVLLIKTRKRVLQLATELKYKCDAWFEALNNVMRFIHRNDMTKGALIPD